MWLIQFYQLTRSRSSEKAALVVRTKYGYSKSEDNIIFRRHVKCRPTKKSNFPRKRTFQLHKYVHRNKILRWAVPGHPGLATHEQDVRLVCRWLYKPFLCLRSAKTLARSISATYFTIMRLHTHDRSTDEKQPGVKVLCDNVEKVRSYRK